MAADRIFESAEEFPFEPIQRATIRADRFDGNFVVEGIEFRRLFSFSCIGRVKVLPGRAITVASGEITAWVIPKHPHCRLGERTSDRLLLALFVTFAVSVNWLSHRTLS